MTQSPLLVALALALPTLAGCPTTPCTPVSCIELGSLCGTPDDGCGGTLDCGGCGPGEACESDSTCVCAKTTCAAQGKNCGEIDDGCGGTLNCGTCSGSEVCGATNVCGSTPCTPKTCDELGVVCGKVSNGCGKTLSCNACGAGNACSGTTCVACAGSSWATTAKPWMDANCIRCHEHATWTEATVRSKASAIRSRVVSGNMPKDDRLTAAEKQVILTWIDCGMP